MIWRLPAYPWFPGHRSPQRRNGGGSSRAAEHSAPDRRVGPAAAPGPRAFGPPHGDGGPQASPAPPLLQPTPPATVRRPARGTAALAAEDPDPSGRNRRRRRRDRMLLSLCPHVPGSTPRGRASPLELASPTRADPARGRPGCSRRRRGHRDGPGAFPRQDLARYRHPPGRSGVRGIAGTPAGVVSSRRVVRRALASAIRNRDLRSDRGCRRRLAVQRAADRPQVGRRRCR